MYQVQCSIVGTSEPEGDQKIAVSTPVETLYEDIIARQTLSTQRKVHHKVIYLHGESAVIAFSNDVPFQSTAPIVFLPSLRSAPFAQE